MSTTQTTEKAEAHTAEQSAKHTPGPWKVKAGTNVFYVACHKGYLAKTTGDTREDEANARLIAAAPELLEACKIMVEAFNGCTCTDEHKSEGVPCPWCMGADAIAKAEKGAL